MINYKIADMASRLNNAFIVGNIGVDIPYSKDCYAILKVLAHLGYLVINSSNSQTPSGDVTSAAASADIKFKDRVINVSFLSGSHQTINEDYSAITSFEGSDASSAPATTPIGRQGKLLTVVSKPGRRIYVGYRSASIKSNQGGKQGYSTYILRTSKGIISATNAIKNKVGGEVLLKVS